MAKITTNLKSLNFNHAVLAHSALRKVIIFLHQRLQPIKLEQKNARRQAINKMDIQAVESKIQIVEAIIEVFQKHKYEVQDGTKSLELVDFILDVLTRETDSITDQEIEDVTLEINRLARCIQFEIIQNTNITLYGSSNENKKTIIERVKKIIFCNHRYELFYFFLLA